jgi:hypothetical protein
MADVRRLLASGEPLDLLAEISGIVSTLDPRSKSPMERGMGSSHIVTLAELTDSFAGVDQRETTALLTGIGRLGFDEAVRRKAAAAAARREHPLPEWLDRLGEAVAYRAVEMVHVLGDGDDIIVGVRLATGHELSFVIYVDHNLGTVVKDAFVVPQPIGDLIGLMKEHEGAPSDTEWNDLDLADARARAEGALEKGALVWPPFESDSWPVGRPLVEWALRLLPEGGTGHRRPEWSDEDRAELTEAFFGSPFAGGVGGDSYRDLFESLLWFGCDYGPGDPLRWSPVSVEIVLADWIPRKIVAGVGFLSKAPDLLRAFIRYAGDRRGLAPALVAETLAAVDHWEPEYQRLIRTPRPQGPMALLADLDAIDPNQEWDDYDDAWDDPLDIGEIMLDSLRREVGGHAALDVLDTAPLPDEEFAWDGVSDEIHASVGEVLEWCDRYCDRFLDTEYRTACRRFLARVAVGDPRVFRRRGRIEGAAAAVCWVIGKANKLFSPAEGGVYVKDMAAFFDVSASNVSQRAGTLMKAAGGTSDDYYHHSSWHVSLGSPDLLVSRRRQRIIELRDSYSGPETPEP